MGIERGYCITVFQFQQVEKGIKTKYRLIPSEIQ